ncbi:hypothetical protein OKW30_005934 [Paraburkholderia sp. Clong3]|uniref:hypothetical protein n=1 Tax=Paraburkholderia sp. Clong3 TaxID=2991061 RepID=UPI003D1AAA57
MKAVKQDAAFDQAPRLNQYEMELSRGASHIASTLYEESMLAAVSETILHFEASHGRDDLKSFAHALLRRLEQRGRPLAGKVLQRFIERGRLPEEVPSAPPVPASARKPAARKLKGTALPAANARQAA